MNNFRNAAKKMSNPKIPNPKATGVLAAALGAVGVFGYGAYNSVFTVKAGQRAVMYNKIGGVDKEVLSEGTHVCIPWFQKPFIFDTRIRPTTIKSPTGTKDLQMVDITLRVLYKPVKEALPSILTKIGEDYDARVLPSIANETLKSVVAQFNASQLITQREQVSRLIKRNLTERARDFHILVDDVSITHSTFSPEYAAAVEAKQVAQQEAERAKFVVKQAEQDKRSRIIQAKSEAESVRLVGGIDKNYIELRQLDVARDIAEKVAKSNNKLVLDSESLLLNVFTLGPNDEQVKK